MDTQIERFIADIDKKFKHEECPDAKEAKIFGPSETQESFKKIGLISVENLLKYADLRENDRVLDIGCGIGRVALPLVHYLDSKGSYQGIDPVETAITWCRRKISEHNPNFSFEYVDWYNGMYNKSGSVDPATYTFGYADDSFDLIYLFSVFTHMKPDGVENYLREIFRMLPNPGRVFMTMFVVDKDTEKRIASNETHRSFFKGDRNYWTDNHNIHESAIAYGYQYVMELLEEIGFHDVQFVPGGWRDKKAGQDILVAYK